MLSIVCVLPMEVDEAHRFSSLLLPYSGAEKLRMNSVATKPFKERRTSWTAPRIKKGSGARLEQRYIPLYSVAEV